MVGADIVPDPVILGSTLPVAPPIFAAGPDSGGSLRDRVLAPPALAARRARLCHAGPGACGHAPRTSTLASISQCRWGALVRAAGGGIVLQTGEHEQYGRFVLLEHPDGYQSMYGHLSRIIAVQGAPVNAGEVIARSGNTGRSSAPHLHFEIRLNGVSIDPGNDGEGGTLMGIFSAPSTTAAPPVERRRLNGAQGGLSIVAKDLTIAGDLQAEGVVRIEGRVIGNVHAGDQVLISEGGIVEGDVVTRRPWSPGRVHGCIHGGGAGRAPGLGRRARRHHDPPAPDPGRRAGERRGEDGELAGSVSGEQ